MDELSLEISYYLNSEGGSYEKLQQLADKIGVDLTTRISEVHTDILNTEEDLDLLV